MHPRIVLNGTRGGLAGRQFAFGPNMACVVGRALDCGLRLPVEDFTISRHHCLFDVTDTNATVSDLGSLNGTYVNGERLVEVEQGNEGRSRVLADGDEVQLGTATFRVQVLDEGAEKARPELCEACCS